MAKKSRPPKRKPGAARYTWRPEIGGPVRWEVIRLNEDGSETHYSYERSEEEAKKMAATMDKAAREGRE
jgi:hypothetical protein